MFEGSYPLSLDAKGRLTIPAKLRDDLVQPGDGLITVTRWLDNCLRVYPQPAWARLRDEIMPTWPMTASTFGKALLQSADTQRIDGAGRILIKDSLRAYANLDKRVVLAGDGGVLELWDEDRHTRFLDEQLALGLPPELKQMTKF
jgi:MraZ protein